MKSHTRYSSNYFKDIYNALKPKKPWGGKRTSAAQPSTPIGSAVCQPAPGVLRPAVIVPDKRLDSPRAENTNEQFDSASSSDTTSRQISKNSSAISIQNQPTQQTQVCSGNVRQLARANAWKPNGKSRESLTAQSHLTMVHQQGRSGIATLVARLNRVKLLEEELKHAHREIAEIKSQLDDLYKPSRTLKWTPAETRLQEKRAAAADRIAALLKDVQTEGKAFELELERFNNILTAHAGTHGADPTITTALKRLETESQQCAWQCKQLCKSAVDIAKSAADYAPHTRLSRLVESAPGTPAKPVLPVVQPRPNGISPGTQKAEASEGDLSESLIEDDPADLAKDFSTQIAIDAKDAGNILAKMTTIAESMMPHLTQLQTIESNIQTWLQSNPDQLRATADVHYATYRAESEKATKLGREQLGQLQRDLLVMVSRGAELLQHNDARKDIGSARQDARAHWAQLSGLLTQANDLIARAAS
ncbi:hypothetical protein [uncultured Hydrogenophaga sp.]|uniref:hypothetical protein n=1 Tax=uncultured Hydrogenophaga sp. TaxID=199683 RepID=UPI00265D6B0E|nr:hypothetical protein [uncultured Hydrogenophaga sp.]